MANSGSAFKRFLAPIQRAYHRSRRQPSPSLPKDMAERNAAHLEQIAQAVELSPHLKVAIAFYEDACDDCKAAARWFYKVEDAPKLPLHEGCRCRYHPFVHATSDDDPGADSSET